MKPEAIIIAAGIRLQSWVLLLLQLNGKAADVQLVDEEVGAAALEVDGARSLLWRWLPQQALAVVLQRE